MDAKLPDPRPLIHVCDRHDFVEEMTSYLHSNQLQKYIEVYCNKVSPQKTPLVVGKLLDLDANEDFVRGLLNSVGHACPVEELVEQVERRNRLRLLQPWLEARIATGNQEVGTHNAIGKIYVTLNRDPVSFLTNDQWYDPAVLGKYCEKLDPSLAFIAYKRAGGACDQDLIRVTTAHGLFKDQARYLVEKQDLELWATVLTPPEEEQPGDTSEQNRRSLIDQVVQTALPETRDPDHVSTTVKAFMAADLPHELIELLERIVLQGSDFSENKNLQNLLILTAIKADKDRVMEYINRLDNFDGPEIAKIAISDEYGMYEEGFVIYTKFAKAAAKAEEATELNVLAMGVLVGDLKAMERATEFAERADDKKVWLRLAKAQLAEGLLAPAIASYLKADDHKDWPQVVSAAEGSDSYEELVPYLVMARTHVKETQLDTTLIYAYAMADKLGELEEFISAPNVARIDDVGERCFDEQMFSAAKLLFASINNNAKLALCLVNLEQYREAVDAARKANSVSTWKEVNRVCVRAGEFKLARIAGLQIIVHPDHLEELTSLYERSGATDELIELMEQGLGLDQAHSGVFTELGVLYSKYVPEKLMEHIKIFWYVSRRPFKTFSQRVPGAGAASTASWAARTPTPSKSTARPPTSIVPGERRPHGTQRSQVENECPEGDEGLRESFTVGRGRLPAQGGRAVRLGGQDDDRPSVRLPSRFIFGLRQEGKKRGGLLQGDSVLRQAAAAAAESVAAGPDAQSRPLSRHAPTQEAGEPTSRAAVPPRRAKREPDGRE